MHHVKSGLSKLFFQIMFGNHYPDSKVHGASMGPTWVLSAPDGPHVGPMNFAIRVTVATNSPKFSHSGPTFCLTACLPQAVWQYPSNQRGKSCHNSLEWLLNLPWMNCLSWLKDHRGAVQGYSAKNTDVTPLQECQIKCNSSVNEAGDLMGECFQEHVLWTFYKNQK